MQKNRRVMLKKMVVSLIFYLILLLIEMNFKI